MSRRLIVALFALLVAFSAVSATGVQASTECEKWLTTYKDALGKTDTAHKLAAAKHRAQRKLTGYVAPKPKTAVLPTRKRRPPMSKEEALKRFQLACGELPDTNAPPQLLAENKGGPYITPDEVVPGEDTGFLPNLDSPVFTATATDVPPDDGGGLPQGGPVFAATGGISGGSPSVTPPPIVPPPVTPPVTPVPEPGSIALVLTGLAGAAGMLRNRFRV